MPDKTNDTVIATVMEQLMAEGPQAMAQAIAALMNLAMRMEREQFLGAGHDERVVDRRGYGNGTKPGPIDTLAGTAELGCAQDGRNGRAVLPASAGPKPAVWANARAARSCWRWPRCRCAVSRPASLCGSWPSSARELVIDPSHPGPGSAGPPSCSTTNSKLGAAERSAKSVTSFWMPAHEKSRQGGVVRDAAVLSAIDVGVSVAPSEAEVHWRAFLENLVGRGMRGVRFITSDDHAGPLVDSATRCNTVTDRVSV